MLIANTLLQSSLLLILLAILTESLTRRLREPLNPLNVANRTGRVKPYLTRRSCSSDLFRGLL